MKRTLEELNKMTIELDPTIVGEYLVHWFDDNKIIEDVENNIFEVDGLNLVVHVKDEYYYKDDSMREEEHTTLSKYSKTHTIIDIPFFLPLDGGTVESLFNNYLNVMNPDAIQKTDCFVKYPVILGELHFPSGFSEKGQIAFREDLLNCENHRDKIYQRLYESLMEYVAHRKGSLHDVFHYTDDTLQYVVDIFEIHTRESKTIENVHVVGFDFDVEVVRKTLQDHYYGKNKNKPSMKPSVTKSLTDYENIIFNKFNYLSEGLLGCYVRHIFKNCEVIHNKQVPNSGLKTRPDYRIDDLMLIIEFDGNRHFQQSGTQRRDLIKDNIYMEMGYKIIRIPYFVQMDSSALEYFFGEYLGDIDTSEISSYYPHGFVDMSCTYPSDFNAYGTFVYKEYINNLPQEVVDGIKNSYSHKYTNDGLSAFELLPFGEDGKEYVTSVISELTDPNKHRSYDWKMKSYAMIEEYNDILQMSDNVYFKEREEERD